MVGFEEAYEIAKGLKKNIDMCNEYDVGYEFASSEEAYSFGGAGACCVLKESGKVVNQTTFFDEYNPVFIGKRSY